MGAHYQQINSPNYLNINTDIKKIVDDKVKEFEDLMNSEIAEGKTVMIFNDNNKATEASINSPIQGYFTNFIAVKLILHHLPNKISSGTDRIPPVVLKHLPNKMIQDLTILFNNSLNNYYFPNQWKTDLVIPIHKNGKKETDPASYRPISMTPAIRKVYEATLNNSINFYEKKK